MKTFWVDCPPPSSSSTSTGTTTSGSESNTESNTESTTESSTNSTSTTPPSTQIPFFPSATAAVLGIAGALGGALLAFRRRL